MPPGMPGHPPSFYWGKTGAGEGDAAGSGGVPGLAPHPPTPHSLMPGAAMVILETTTCAMPFAAALCKQKQGVSPHRTVP